MGFLNTGGSSLWTTQLTTMANTTNIYTPGYANGDGYYIMLPGSFDPLAQQAKPRPESNEEWLRRRVREVQWKPA